MGQEGVWGELTVKFQPVPHKVKLDPWPSSRFEREISEGYSTVCAKTEP